MRCARLRVMLLNLMHVHRTLLPGAATNRISDVHWSTSTMCGHGAARGHCGVVACTGHRSATVARRVWRIGGHHTAHQRAVDPRRSDSLFKGVLSNRLVCALAKLGTSSSPTLRWLHARTTLLTFVAVF
jgi:hypothetical protein